MRTKEAMMATACATLRKRRSRDQMMADDRIFRLASTLNNTSKLPRDSFTGELEPYAWPGGYPIYYICRDSGVLCPHCANEAETEGLTGDRDDPQWDIVAADINYEDPSLLCDHCGERIESAYAEDEVEP